MRNKTIYDRTKNGQQIVKVVSPWCSYLVMFIYLFILLYVLLREGERERREREGGREIERETKKAEKVVRCRGRQSSREPDIFERKRARGTLPAGRKARARHHVSKQGSQLPRKTAAQEQPEEEGREKGRERERERERGEESKETK